MQKIAQFFKVSKENYIQALRGEFPAYDEAAAEKIYEELKLPMRATKGSAGYDFYAPFSFTLAPGETIKIPTGIRAKMEEGWVLQLFPRSGLGFKFRLQLNNTVGIIDSDYFDSDNEGHIFAKITNDSNEGKTLQVEAGTGFLQGIFLPFGITVDDEADGIRNGGFGDGGTNFDAKTRRNSTDLEDIFIAHIAGMDVMARALESAAKLLEESPYKKMLADRYASFDSGKGKEFEEGKLTLEDVVAYAKANGEPKQTSGKQELYEAIVNMYC